MNFKKWLKSKTKIKVYWSGYMWAIVAAIVVGLVGVISYHMTYAISTSFRFDLWRFTTNSYMQWFVDKPTDLDQNALVFVPFVRANSLYLVDAILFWVAIAVLLGLFVYSLFTRNTSKVGFVLSLDFLSFVYFVIQIVYTVFAMQDFTISSDGTKIYGLDSVKGNSGILFNCLCLAGIIWLSILHMDKENYSNVVVSTTNYLTVTHKDGVATLVCDISIMKGFKYENYGCASASTDGVLPPPVDTQNKRWGTVTASSLYLECDYAYTFNSTDGTGAYYTQTFGSDSITGCLA